MTAVALYWPNIIGYVRVISGIASFFYAFEASTWPAFVYLYAFSYALDALDGVAARRFKQESTFGAVLDMVTDRVCTAGLLAVIVWVHASAATPDPWARALAVWLIILDVGSHWLQMYR
jgi:CDP-diacylglycerol--inositol 3-phosphatidyltransferase